jgi:hypothetical protein
MEKMMNFRKAAIFTAASGAIALLSPTANADIIVSGIPTFGGGNENIATTLAILDAINPNIVYLGSYIDTSPGALALPTGESISGTGTHSSGTITSNSSGNPYSILYYDVKAGPGSDLIEVSNPGAVVDWTTDWSNLLVGRGNVPDVSHIDVFGVDPPLPPSPAPEPASLTLFASALLGLGFLAYRKRKAS